MLVNLWLSFLCANGNFELASKRKLETHHLTRSMRVWLQKKLVDYFHDHPNLVFCWLHRDVLKLFSDEPFIPQCRTNCIMTGTKTVLCGLFAMIEKSTNGYKLGSIPLPILYDELARELTRRVYSAWMQSKNETTTLAKHRHEQYLLQLTYHVSQYALSRHAPLVVVAIELCILTMICLSTKHDTKPPMDLLQCAQCEQCLSAGQGCVAHRELVKLITKLYQSQPDVTLLSVTDSPQSSPLSALSIDGLDLGHTFLLVSKFMQWHELALAEAQALSVCSEWMSASEEPCSLEFYERMSTMQADAESRALRNVSPNRSDYVYDDIIDAYVLRDSSIPNMSPLVTQRINSRTVMKRKSNTVYEHRSTMKIPQPKSEDDDEIDFLTNKSILSSARVCRKVQRLDIGKENRKRMQYASTSSRRNSLLPYM